MEPDRPRRLIDFDPDDRAHGFDSAYLATPPWEIGHAQPVLAALVGEMTGRVIDVGCGTGEHAMLAAAHGATATGVDLSPRAIAIATGRAAARGLDVRFIVGDALRLDESTGGGRFDVALDSGVFHTFQDPDRPRYVESVASVVPPDGRLFLVCFSDDEPGAWGPRRVGDAELRDAFEGPLWTVESIEPAAFELAGTAGMPRSARATLARIRRR